MARGAYSDDPAFGRARLDAITGEQHTDGAFRTASLRGVAQRRGFGHRGTLADLEDFIDDIYDDPHLQAGAVGTLDPAMDDLSVSKTAHLAAFLHMLDCPLPSPEWLAP